MLVRPRDGRVDADVPHDRAGSVGECLQRRQDLCPHSAALPAPEQPVHRLPRSVPGRDVPPGGTRAGPPPDAVDGLAFRPFRRAARLLPRGSSGPTTTTARRSGLLAPADADTVSGHGRDHRAPPGGLPASSTRVAAVRVAQAWRRAETGGPREVSARAHRGMPGAPTSSRPPMVMNGGQGQLSPPGRRWRCHLSAPSGSAGAPNRPRAGERSAAHPGREFRRRETGIPPGRSADALGPHGGQRYALTHTAQAGFPGGADTVRRRPSEMDPSRGLHERGPHR